MYVEMNKDSIQSLLYNLNKDTRKLTSGEH